MRFKTRLLVLTAVFVAVGMSPASPSNSFKPWAKAPRLNPRSSSASVMENLSVIHERP